MLPVYLNNEMVSVTSLLCHRWKCDLTLVPILRPTEHHFLHPWPTICFLGPFSDYVSNQKLKTYLGTVHVFSRISIMVGIALHDPL